MVDFRAKSGVFAPQTPSSTPDALKEIRDMILELTGRVGEIEKKLGVSPLPVLAPVSSSKPSSAPTLN
jgi:hypothetical protein